MAVEIDSVDPETGEIKNQMPSKGGLHTASASSIRTINNDPL